MREIGACRVLLFTPGNRPERFPKAAATGTDAVILDLEDAVSLTDKDKARSTLLDFFKKPQDLFGLRVNNIHTPAGVRDLDALIGSGVRPAFLVLPKVESSIEVQRYSSLLKLPLICTVESARGLEAAVEIANADPLVQALAFGGADLAVDLRAELAWEPMLWGRGRIAQAAATAGISAIDVPHVVLDDEAGLRADAVRVKAMGFSGKLAIHPKQVAPILEIFTPSAAELERAAAIVAAYEKSGGNVVEYQGKMVEGPIVKSAQRLLALARR